MSVFGAASPEKMEPGRPDQHPVLCRPSTPRKVEHGWAPRPRRQHLPVPGGVTMDVLYPHSAAIDVHKRTAVVTVAWTDERGRRRRETRTYGTATSDIERLRRGWPSAG